MTNSVSPQDGGAALVWLECPECGFDAVIYESENIRTALCPLCAGDTGRDVDMREGNGPIPDKVEGRDVRRARSARGEK